MEHKSDGETNWCSWYSHQRTDTRTGGLGYKRTSVDHPNYYITEIEQNTEERPWNLKRLAFTQTPVRNHQLTLVWKTWKGVNKIILVDALVTVLSYQEKWQKESEIRGRIETIQTTALLRSARMLRRVQESCYHSDFCEKPPALAGLKNSLGVK